MRATPVLAVVVALLAGSAGQVVAEDEPLFGPMSPARVSGQFTPVGDRVEGTVQELGELMYRVEGSVGTYQVSSDDARLGGTAVSTGDLTGYYPPALVAVTDVAWFIEDERGSWSGSTRGIASMADEDPVNVDQSVSLDGAGAYDGLTAYLVIDKVDESFVGAIIPDVMPELPDDWMELYQAAADEE